MMLLCEKCNNFYFPECDEDGCWSIGCKNPNVLEVFNNFCRRYKCKYYQKISLEKMLRETKRVLTRITNHLFHYRDSKYVRKASRFIMGLVKTRLETYLGYRDYLMRLIKESDE